MTLNEAITLILTILKQVMEEKLSSNNVEVVTVTPNNLFHMLSKEELEKVSCLDLVVFTRFYVEIHFNLYLFHIGSGKCCTTRER